MLRTASPATTGVPDDGSATGGARRRPAPVLLLLLLLASAVVVVHNLLVAAGLDEAGTVAVNVVLAAGAVVAARRFGLGADDLGLRTSRAGWLTATGAALASVAVVLVAARSGRLPPTPRWRRCRRRPRGSACSSPSPWAPRCARRSCSAACCSVRCSGRAVALVVTSVAFGLWHVAAEVARTGSLGPAVVPGVLATAAASALVLVPLRWRAGDLAAPIAVHAIINVGILLAVHAAA